MSIILKNQVNNVQILRAIAAIWVVSYHTLLNLESDKIHVHLFSLIANKGLAGVDIFFVISGFIMMKTQIMHPRKPTEFYLKRLIRIVPMYYFVTMLYCSIFFVDPSLFGTFRFSLSWLIASLTFTSGLASLGPPIVILGWTLEFEILFYALLGVTSKFFKETKLMIVVSLLLILLVLFGVNAIVFEFVLGMLASYASLKLRIPLIIARICTVLGILGFVLNLVMDLSGISRVLIFGIPAFLIVLGQANLKQSKNQALVALGNSSYSTYLVQILTIPAFFKTVHLLKIGDGFGELLAWVCILFTILCGHFLFGRLENYLNAKISQHYISKNEDKLL